MTALIDDYDAIARTVQLYIDGAAKGDASKLREAFHSDARMFGALGGQRVDIPIAALIDLSVEHPLDSDGSYRGRIGSITQVGDAALATIAEDGCWGGVSFVDFMSLARIDGVWKIVNKTFAHTGGKPPF
jgi:hypothetical protein